MTDESQTLATEMLDCSGVIDQVLRGVVKMLAPMDIAPDSVDGLREPLRQACIQVYAETYTDTEMRDAIAFFGSESGSAFRAKIQIVESRINVLTQQLIVTWLDKELQA